MSKSIPDPNIDGLENFNLHEFGSIWPASKRFASFPSNRGPWHEMRWHFALFIAHVAPVDMKQLDVRETWSPEMRNDAIFFVRFIRSKNSKSPMPPPDLLSVS